RHASAPLRARAARGDRARGAPSGLQTDDARASRRASEGLRRSKKISAVTSEARVARGFATRRGSCQRRIEVPGSREFSGFPQPRRGGRLLQIASKSYSFPQLAELSVSRHTT